MALRTNRKKLTKEGKQKRIFTKLAPDSMIADQYRTIRARIQGLHTGKEIRKILVTSPGDSEGKTTIATNLAISFAQQGQKVLLVDGNIRKPSIHETFYMENSLGLTSVLSGREHFKQAVKETEIDGLHLLLSGPDLIGLGEMLGSKEMKEVVDMMSMNYDMVIFDAPSVLTSPGDTLNLSNQSDGIILVTQNGRTRVDDSMKALNILGHTKASFLGAVFNN